MSWNPLGLGVLLASGTSGTGAAGAAGAAGGGASAGGGALGAVSGKYSFDGGATSTANETRLSGSVSLLGALSSLSTLWMEESTGVSLVTAGSSTAAANATRWAFACAPGVRGVAGAIGAIGASSADGRVAPGAGAACRTFCLDERRRKMLGLGLDLDFGLRGMGARSQKVSGTKKNRRMPQKPVTMAKILKKQNG